MANHPHRRLQAQTGELTCTHCRETKPLSAFRQNSDGRWRSWCKDCERQSLRDRYQLQGKRSVQVLITTADLEYMMDEMVPNNVSRNFTQAANRVIADAVGAHKKRRAVDAMPMPIDVKPGWPDKKRLMAGR